MRVLPVRTLFFVLLLASLSGCGVIPTNLPSSSSAIQDGPAITGSVHGGLPPVVGAHVYLYGVTGSGGAASLLGTGTGLPDGSVTGEDALGRYVVTGSDGSFSFNNSQGLKSYACHNEDLVYVLAVGGNTGAGVPNPAAYLMADLGTCASGTLSSSLYVHLNEVSTAAAVYALAGYMNGPTSFLHYDALGQTGVINASAAAARLETLGTGAALTSSPDAFGYGAPNAAMLNTVANVIAACVDSDGSTAPAAACGQLFANTTADGTPTGTQPAESITALLNLVHHPAVNVAALYALQGTQPPYAGLLVQPNDFLLAVQHNGHQLTLAYLQSPAAPAVNAAGQVWFASTVLNPSSNPLTVTANVELVNPQGDFFLNSSTTNIPSTIAVDPGQIFSLWIGLGAGGGYNALYTATRYSGYWSMFPTLVNSLAVSSTGLVYIGDETGRTIYKLQATSSRMVTKSAGPAGSQIGALTLLSDAELIAVKGGSQLNGFATSNLAANTICGSAGVCSGGGLSSPTFLAANASGFVWALNNNNTLSKFDTSSTDNGNTGNFVTGSPFSGGGLNTTLVSPHPVVPSMALDGAGNVWIANYSGTVSEFSDGGTALSPSTGLFGSSATCKGQGLAIDGSGNVWVGCDNSVTAGSPAPIVEYIGAAVPAYVPIVPGKVGVRP